VTITKVKPSSFHIRISTSMISSRTPPDGALSDSAQSVRGAEPRGPPAAERAGGQPARHGQGDREGDGRQADQGGECDIEGLRRRLAARTAPQAPEAAATGSASTAQLCLHRGTHGGHRIRPRQSQRDPQRTAHQTVDHRLSDHLPRHPARPPAQCLERAELASGERPPRTSAGPPPGTRPRGRRPTATCRRSRRGAPQRGEGHGGKPGTVCDEGLSRA
jgi:hypothetical protein